jgi:hypothetical protein
MSVSFVIYVALFVYYTSLGGGRYGYMGRRNRWHQNFLVLMGAALFVDIMFYIIDMDLNGPPLRFSILPISTTTTTTITEEGYYCINLYDWLGGYHCTMVDYV